jgi:hypothetical protein
MPCWEGYRPVNSETIDGNVHTPAETSSRNWVYSDANASRFGVVGCGYP